MGTADDAWPEGTNTTEMIEVEEHTEEGKHEAGGVGVRDKRELVDRENTGEEEGVRTSERRKG